MTDPRIEQQDSAHAATQARRLQDGTSQPGAGGPAIIADPEYMLKHFRGPGLRTCTSTADSRTAAAMLLTFGPACAVDSLYEALANWQPRAISEIPDIRIATKLVVMRTATGFTAPAESRIAAPAARSRKRKT